MRRLVVACTMLALLCAGAQAAIIGVDTVGTSAPPATLGPYLMTPFPDDPRAQFSAVTDAPGPLGLDVAFDRTMYLLTVGSGWATWSHGYSGDVYSTQGATDVTMTLPAGTTAFYFYAEPNPYELWTITATAQDGTSIVQDVHGSSGAKYFGFYGTGGDMVASVAVESDTDFAVGEFGIAQVPEPATLGLCGAGLLALIRRRRRRS
ncbi:MAG: PEP-CTERM sorting domain-containing protein [Candidatus Brocadiia bacterium]